VGASPSSPPACWPRRPGHPTWSPRYFPADGLAFAAAAGLVVGAGYGLELAQRQSDLWLTTIGAAGLIALSGLLTWYVRREPKERSKHSVPARPVPRSPDSRRRPLAGYGGLAVRS